MFALFKRKKGCLYGKTQDEKTKFFKSLSGFASTDIAFFEQQYLDLLPQERKEFSAWVKQDTNELKQLKALIDTLSILLKRKYNQ